LGEVIALDRHSVDLCGDLANPDSIRKAVRQVRPDVIVNAAAYTAVDKAESDAATARAVNAEAAGALAEAASAVGAWLVHYSTDYVFDGSGSQPWEEGDPTGPLCVYGRTKLEGEQHIAARCAKHLILRTSWVYAARGGNFAKTLLRLAMERDRLTVLDDQFGAPTSAAIIADAIAAMFAAPQGISDVIARDSGLVHLAASGITTRHEFGCAVVECLKAKGPPLKVTRIVPISSDSHPMKAKRPLNCGLDLTRLAQTFGICTPHWRSGLEAAATDLLPIDDTPAC